MHSLNLMLPKEERRALLLRLFNDDTPLVNISQRNANGDAPKVEVMVESSIEQEEARQRRNSSSAEEADGGVRADGMYPAGGLAEDVKAESSIS